MKRLRKISVILLILMTATSLSLNAQRAMRGMRADTTGMNRQRMGQMQMQKPGMMQNPDSMQMRMMRRGMGPMRMYMRGMMRNPDSTRMRMMHRGMGPMGMNNMFPPMFPMFDRQRMTPFGPPMGMGMWRHAPGMMFRGMNAAPGTRILENIPNLTEKQKKEIADLRQKHQDEMQKFRSDMQAKMKEMRESQRAKVMSLLTDEQKKWFEENTPKSFNR
jgi:hypothetical protein